MRYINIYKIAILLKFLWYVKVKNDEDRECLSEFGLLSAVPCPLLVTPSVASANFGNEMCPSGPLTPTCLAMKESSLQGLSFYSRAVFFVF